MYYGYYIPPPKQPGPPLADELARLRAIESAAREYRDAVSVYRQRCAGLGYTSGADGDVRDTEARLFALLNGTTT